LGEGEDVRPEEGEAAREKRASSQEGIVKKLTLFFWVMDISCSTSAIFWAVVILKGRERKGGRSDGTSS